MRALRIIGRVLLSAFALLGVFSGVVWGANAMGLMQPFVVMSGSMEPEIMTGDLIVATPTPVEALFVGDVATLISAHSDTPVTHRIIDIVPVGDGYDIRMQGDANEVPDGEAYHVAAGAEVWQPSLTLSGAVLCGNNVPAWSDDRAGRGATRDHRTHFDAVRTD